MTGIQPGCQHAGPAANHCGLFKFSNFLVYIRACLDKLLVRIVNPEFETNSSRAVHEKLSDVLGMKTNRATSSAKKSVYVKLRGAV